MISKCYSYIPDMISKWYSYIPDMVSKWYSYIPDMISKWYSYIPDMVSKWQSLAVLAAERQKQSACLASIYHNLITVKSSLQDITDELDKDCFDNVTDLEHSIKVLQVI